jgi:hypothetical protein
MQDAYRIFRRQALRDQACLWQKTRRAKLSCGTCSLSYSSLVHLWDICLACCTDIDLSEAPFGTGQTAHVVPTCEIVDSFFISHLHFCAPDFPRVFERASAGFRERCIPDSVRCLGRHAKPVHICRAGHASRLFIRVFSRDTVTVGYVFSRGTLSHDEKRACSFFALGGETERRPQGISLEPKSECAYVRGAYVRTSIEEVRSARFVFPTR